MDTGIFSVDGISSSEQAGIANLKSWLSNGHKTIGVSGFSGSAQTYFFSRFIKDLERPCLVILPDKKRAERFYRELQFFMGGMQELSPETLPRLHRFPPYDMSPLTGLSPHGEVVASRIRALYALMTDSAPVVVSSPEALCFKVLPEEALVDALEYLQEGNIVDRDDFVRILEKGGYQRASMVEDLGGLFGQRRCGGYFFPAVCAAGAAGVLG